LKPRDSNIAVANDNNIYREQPSGFRVGMSGLVFNIPELCPEAPTTSIELGFHSRVEK
jgi:hypothetical protein